jgi:hypothetical protein
MSQACQTAYSKKNTGFQPRIGNPSPEYITKVAPAGSGRLSHFRHHHGVLIRAG